MKWLRNCSYKRTGYNSIFYTKKGSLHRREPFFVGSIHHLFAMEDAIGKMVFAGKSCRVGRVLVDQQPIHTQLAHSIGETLEIDRFSHVTVGSQAVTGNNIFFFT